MSNNLKRKNLTADEKRSLHRIPNKQQNYFRCVVHTNKGSFDGLIIDLTSNGLAIEVKDDIFFSGDCEISEIDVSYAKKNITTIKSFKIVRQDSIKKCIAIEIVQNEKFRGLRKTNRLRLNTKFLPQITGDDPLRPYEKLIFIVTDITKNGMKLSTSLRNKHILPGMKYKNFEISIPGEGSFLINFELVHINIENGNLIIGASIFDSNTKLRDAFSRLAFFAATAKAANPVDAIELIRKSNFSLKKIADSIKVDVVHTEEEFYQALQVRLEAYRAVNKVAKDATIEQMQDKFDEYSITYIAKINDKVIATFRFTESEEIGKPLPFESYYNYDKFIKINRKDVYEVSRLGILPAFAGTDLLLAMFRVVSRDVARSKKSMIILSTNLLKKIYLDLGSRVLSEEVDHPAIKGEKLNLLLLDINDYLFGTKIKEKNWHKIVKGNLDNLFRFGFLEKDLLRKNFKNIKELLRKKKNEDDE